MDVFRFRDGVISEYQDYVDSFISIRDPRIREQVAEELRTGLLWPDPRIGLNPSFALGPWIDELVDAGELHPECKRIFRVKPEGAPDKPLRLYRHQADAIRAARTGQNYVLTTGTGSGKSLSYIVPIVDHIVRNGSGRGIQAIVVYPMNALANSQYGELEKFISHGYPDRKGPVRFERYTGQEDDEQRAAILANPPDILLTNYVMLELVLTRVTERRLVRASQGLRFLVLDELHTYRGRQGADVALLVRRVREACAATQLQCVGTSATLASGGNLEEQRQEVARVASLLFGSEVSRQHVIGETLRRATPDVDLLDPRFVASLAAQVRSVFTPSSAYDAFVGEPLSAWVESKFGVTKESGSDRLVRATPIPVSGKDGAARHLALATGLDEARCVLLIERQLLAGNSVIDPEISAPVFAFRLHQFISRGDTVYASLEQEDDRHLTVQAQKFVPEHREKGLFPLVFCRECGQEYYSVGLVHDGDLASFFPRNPEGPTDEEVGDEGYLFFSSDPDAWPSDPIAQIDRLPDDWVEEGGTRFRIKRDYQKLMPRAVRVDTNGTTNSEGRQHWFVKSPFRFCLRCGVTYNARQRTDFAKLGTLGSEGRSTATTILSLAALRAMRHEELPDQARKLLAFTDNRQDASLQAGHFNDFVEIGLLRSALYRAVVEAGSDGILHDSLTQRVFDALDLPLDTYAADPAVKYSALDDTRKALREVLGYRLYLDLRRGWRITSPNLEQCGLLQIRYRSLDEVCGDQEIWQGSHLTLAAATPTVRASIAKALLDHMRRELAIKVDYLDRPYHERIVQGSSQRLVPPWALDDRERFVYATILFPRSSRQNDSREWLFLSARGGFGQFLRRKSTFPHYDHKLDLAETEVIIRQLLKALALGGLVQAVVPPRDDVDCPGYQLPAAAMQWVAADGTQRIHDPVRVPRPPVEGGRPNPFFVDLYKHAAQDSRGLEAREHTAQVPYQIRLEREEAFRKGKLPLLYCSPTMELGVDISELNVVGMRNVPPTPANYAQRSGRAGRSGQPALVFTYCSTGSPHDQYFFRRPQLMVSGQVQPPRLDLANEDLLRAHVYAVWLGESGRSLGSSLKELLDLSNDSLQPRLQPDLQADLGRETFRLNTVRRARSLLAGLENDLTKSGWYTESWLEETANAVELRFVEACQRWWGLYRAARAQSNAQQKVITDPSRSPGDKQEAKRLRREAEVQLELLTAESTSTFQSDFYSYRYFASEGFLPGYSFPRLPLSAFIPGSRGKKGEDEFLSRPRFLAISEFGPRNIIYHEGSRYIINKVILPVAEGHDGAAATRDLLKESAKRCERCAYLHPIHGGAGPDLCEWCGSPLGPAITTLFRLQNVATKRRDRINSDEEERQRHGYEIRSALRFAEDGGRPQVHTASVELDGEPVAHLTYGPAATIRRINFGWRRRHDPSQLGFILDLERGFWKAQDQDAAQDDDADPMSARTARVIPYVEDHRNCLVYEPTDALDLGQMASLEGAMKSAIQVAFQLEDAELASEPLPGRKDRRSLLFYEAAEGGAGVLRRLIDDPRALGIAAARALDLCHFDPATGTDMRWPLGGKEPCEAACYDCLMSYRNQLDHRVLDRATISGHLVMLSASRVVAAPGPKSRMQFVAELRAQAMSELEQRWLSTIDQGGFRLPDQANVVIEAAGTRPDFLYEAAAAIYVDGPAHQYPDRANRDRRITAALEDLGYVVIRFPAEEDWLAIVRKYPSVFGKGE